MAAKRRCFTEGDDVYVKVYKKGGGMGMGTRGHCEMHGAIVIRGAAEGWKVL